MTEYIYIQNILTKCIFIIHIAKKLHVQPTKLVKNEYLKQAGWVQAT